MSSIDILEPKRNSMENTIQLISKEFLPLYQEYWQNVAKPKVGRDFNPHIQAIVELWLNGGFKIFVTRDENNTMTGFATCMVYRPLQYNANVLQIQDIYSREGVQGYKDIVAYLGNASKLLNCNEILCTTRVEKFDFHWFGNTWEQREMDIYYRLVKQE